MLFRSGEANASTSASNTFNNSSIYFHNYTSSDYKSFLVDNVMETNATTTYADHYTGLWSNTSAITSVTISISSMVQYSSFYLYGIKKG